MAANPAANDLAYGNQVRCQIEHEDVLIVNRLSWLIASQSFLFTAYAIMLKGRLQARLAHFTAQQELLGRMIPAIAIAVCLLIYLGVIGGVLVMAHLRRDLRRHRESIRDLRPPIQGSTLTLVLGHAAPMLLPPIFIGAWIMLLF